MKRGVAETEGASLADTEDVDRVSAMAFADHIHTVLDIAVDIVVERNHRSPLPGYPQSIKYTSMPSLSRLRTKDLSSCRSTMYGRLTSAYTMRIGTRKGCSTIGVKRYRTRLSSR